jgi:hypothetical protein
VFSLLQSGVILLRLEAGSHEASMLAEVCPVKEIPHLLIIKYPSPAMRCDPQC